MATKTPQGLKRPGLITVCPRKATNVAEKPITEATDRSNSPAVSDTVNPSVSAPPARPGFSAKGGADCVIETVGSATVLAQAYAATRRGGSTVTVGLPHPEQMLTIPAFSLVAEERTLRGSYLGS